MSSVPPPPSPHTDPHLSRPFPLTPSDCSGEAQGGSARATMGYAQERGQWMSPANARAPGGTPASPGLRCQVSSQELAQALILDEAKDVSGKQAWLSP